MITLLNGVEVSFKVL